MKIKLDSGSHTQKLFPMTHLKHSQRDGVGEQLLAVDDRASLSSIHTNAGQRV